jgi:uncharacterized protein (DUF1697 family)
MPIGRTGGRPTGRAGGGRAAPGEAFVALLRGINVGRAKRVAMADLAAVVGSLGFRDVRTVLNSGNVVFRGPARRARAAGPRIEQALLRRTGVVSNVTLLSGQEMAAVVAAMPFDLTARSPSRLMVGFLRGPEDEARVAPLVGQRWAPEEIAAGPRVVYIWCPEGILESRLFTAVAKAAGAGITTRNWSTATKLARLASGVTAGRSRASSG